MEIQVRQTPASPNFEEKDLKAERIQKALQGTAIGLSSIGLITTVAIGIILLAAPLLIPAIAFKALLLTGASLLLLGVALSIAAIAKSCKRISPQEQKLRNEINDFKNQQNVLLSQVRTSEAELNLASNQKQELENKVQEIQAKLDGKLQELDQAQIEFQKLKDINDPNDLLPQLNKQTELATQLQGKLDHLNPKYDKRKTLVKTLIDSELNALAQDVTNNEKIERLEEQLEAAKDAFTKFQLTANTDFGTLNTTISLLKDQITTLLAERNEALQSIKDNEVQHQIKLQEMSTELSQNTSKISELEIAMSNEKKKYEQIINEWEESYDHLNEEYAKLHDSMPKEKVILPETTEDLSQNQELDIDENKLKNEEQDLNVEVTTENKNEPENKNQVIDTEVDPENNS